MPEYRKTVKLILGSHPQQAGREVEPKESSTEPNPALNTTRSEPASVWCTPQGKNIQKNEDEELYQIKLVLPS